jgi:hypothetical protein
MKFVWQQLDYVYHPLPADSLPDYTGSIHTVARNFDELPAAKTVFEDYLHTFDPYPGFTYTNDWTFTWKDVVETWLPLDKSNVYRILGGITLGLWPTYALNELFWNSGVSVPATQQWQFLYESPRGDGWVDLEGDRHEAQG